MKDFIGTQDVISPDRLLELSERADLPGYVQLASHWGAIVLTGYAMDLTYGTIWSVPLFCLQGILINFLYAPEHECDHFTAFKTRWLNIAVARVCGFLILYNNDYHRLTHYHHHRNTQDWENDPELAARDRFDNVYRYIVALLGIKYLWSGRIVPLLSHATGRVQEAYITNRQRQQIIKTGRWFIAGYLIIFIFALMIQSWWPLHYWIGPFVAMRWVYWLQGIAEHGGLTHEPHTLANTRTLKTNAFMRWVNWNMAYHTVHHTYPSVPFFRLPELHREVEQMLGYSLPSDSYFAVHWRHFKSLYQGETELDICERHTREMKKLGRLPE